MGDQTRQQNYPVLVDISQPGPGRAVQAPTPQPVTARSVGAGINRFVADAMSTYAAPALRRTAQIMPATAIPVALGGTQERRVATRDFVEGLFSGNSQPAPAQAPDKAPVDAEKLVKLAVDPVNQALAQGRAATPTITPYDRQLAALSAILGSRNMTLSDLQAATSMLPKPNKPITAKDTMIGQAALSSQQIFQQQLNAAAELAKSDPEKGAAALDKARAENFQRQVAILGANPMNVALAQTQLPDPDKED